MLLLLFAASLAACADSQSSVVQGSVIKGCTPAEFPPGTFSQCRFTEPGLPARDYYVYAPSTLKPGPVPLVVYLHGCTQTAPDAAAGVRWNELAERHGFIVAYPEQYAPAPDQDQVDDGNGSGCWNWFRPEHINRGSGEPATIAGIARAVMGAYDIDPARVYILGASAGGSMSSAVGASYPDLFAAIAIVAGTPYAGADLDGELAAQAMGEFARVMPVMVIHGTSDEAALFPLGVAAVQQWLGTDDRVDDGAENGSIARTPEAIEHHGFDPSLIAGLGQLGDVCLDGSRGVPCPAGALGLDSYPYSIAHYLDALGQPLVDFWVIHGSGHTYVGGDRRGSFTDPHGPDITTAAYEFFLAHPME
ncbi:MAG TPA: PHB depolymerase family esterase [Solimonas sp.]|nr:PHB depolymerase family esterase [Solimonas sp.]